jgi:hypothetical protein
MERAGGEPMWTRVLIVVGLLAGTGWLHGTWTDRWGASGDVAAAATALPSVPLVMGDWEGRDIAREESEVVYRSASPQIVRRYVNRTTGSAVGLLITCGRPSTMIIEHTPKTCYTELLYEEVGEGRKVTVPARPPDKSCEFYAHTFVKSTPAGTTRLRLLWSWGDGRNWSFPERPRVAFARTPVLYKLYVTRDMLSDDEPLDRDPALAFLETALPEISAALSGGNH